MKYLVAFLFLFAVQANAQGLPEIPTRIDCLNLAFEPVYLKHTYLLGKGVKNRRTNESMALICVGQYQQKCTCARFLYQKDNQSEAIVTSKTYPMDTMAHLKYSLRSSDGGSLWKRVHSFTRDLTDQFGWSWSSNAVPVSNATFKYYKSAGKAPENFRAEVILD